MPSEIARIRAPHHRITAGVRQVCALMRDRLRVDRLLEIGCKDARSYRTGYSRYACALGLRVGMIGRPHQRRGSDVSEPQFFAKLA